MIVPETTKKVYPTKELTLPLLTFDMIDSRALPPTDFEENGRSPDIVIELIELERISKLFVLLYL